MSLPDYISVVMPCVLTIDPQGLATAYKLKRAGHSVIVLEKRDHNSMVRLRL